MKKAPETTNCKECGTSLHRKAWKQFCRVECRKAFNNRRQSRGAILYDLAMTFRKRRGSNDFSNLCHQIGIYLQDDQARGRPSFNTSGVRVEWNIPKNGKFRRHIIAKQSGCDIDQIDLTTDHFARRAYYRSTGLSDEDSIAAANAHRINYSLVGEK